MFSLHFPDASLLLLLLCFLPDNIDQQKLSALVTFKLENPKVSFLCNGPKTGWI